MSDTVTIGQVSKLKQGDLLRVCQERGWTQAEMGRRLGISPTDIGKLCNMQGVPKLSDEAQRLIVEWTGKLPEDLVPDWLSLGLDAIDGRRSVRFAEVGQQQLEAVMNRMSLPPHQDEVIDRESIRTLLTKAASILTRRERKILELRFGLGGGEEMTHAEIAQAFALTKSRVSQIEIRALKDLRCRMVKPGLSQDPKFNRLRKEQESGKARRKARLVMLIP